MPLTPDPALQAHGDAPGEVRVVQHRQRRRAIRLEPVFWQALEQAAARREIRLGQLVGELAAAASGRNLTSYLRVYALLETQRDRAAAVLAEGTSDDTGAGRLFRTAPAPGLLLDASAAIIAVNRTCADWLGAGAPNVVGRVLNDAFRVRSTTAFDTLWQGFRTGRRPIVRLNLLHVVPGRVTGAEATLIRLDDAGTTAVAWLASRRTRQTGRSPGEN